MAYEPRDGDGALFQSRDKRTPKAPDYWGRLRLNGKDYKIAGWKKAGQPGKPPFLSLSVQLDEGRGARREEPPRQQPQSDEDIPF